MATGLSEQRQPMTIRDRLKTPGIIAEIGKALPKHCSPERMARVAMTALTRTPKLAECTEASFFKCLLDLSMYGLEPDGRRAHLIPYGKEATLIIDYKGYVELAYRSGLVRSIHADVVHDGDVFRYSNGEVLEHVPHFLRRDPGKPVNRGEVYAAYCVVQMTNGAVKSEVMSRDEIEGIRKRSKAGNNGPWKTDWNEMAKKTVFRRCSKWLPLSSEIVALMDRDDDKLVTIDAVPQPTQTIEELDKLIAGKREDGLTLDQGDAYEPGPDDAPELYEPEAK